jgi:hypothetical protein
MEDPSDEAVTSGLGVESAADKGGTARALRRDGHDFSTAFRDRP